MIESPTPTPRAGVAARLLARWYLVILAVIIAILVAGATLYRVGHSGVTKKQQTFDVATGELLVDLNPSTITNVTGQAGQLAGRAQLIAQYATGPRIVAKIAKHAGIPVDRLVVQSLVTAPSTTGGTQSKGIVSPGKGVNSVVLKATQGGQTISISAQTHSPTRALSLAHATINAVRGAVKTLQNSQPINRASVGAALPPATTTSSVITGPTTTTTTSTTPDAATSAAERHDRAIALSKIVLRPLGAVTTQTVTTAPKKSKAVGYGVGALIVLLIVILLFDNLLVSRRRRRMAAAVPLQPAPAEVPADPTPAED